MSIFYGVKTHPLEGMSIFFHSTDTNIYKYKYTCFIIYVNSFDNLIV